MFVHVSSGGLVPPSSHEKSTSIYSLQHSTSRVLPATSFSFSLMSSIYPGNRGRKKTTESHTANDGSFFFFLYTYIYKISVSLGSGVVVIGRANAAKEKKKKKNSPHKSGSFFFFFFVKGYNASVTSVTTPPI